MQLNTSSKPFLARPEICKNNRIAAVRSENFDDLLHFVAVMDGKLREKCMVL